MKQLTTGLVFTLMALLSMNAHSQTPKTNYDKEWKTFTSLQEKGLSQSALTQAKKIYQLAKKEKQEAQVIRSLVAQFATQTEIRENNHQLSIAEFETELAAANGPAKAILQAMTASLYWQYFQQNRWQLYQRTQTINFEQKDIATWSADDLHKKISTLFLASLSSARTLQATNLTSYEPVITKGNMRHLRPTLFDLLAHEALEYFVSGENMISRPADAYKIDQAAAFDPAADFIHRKFVTTDSLSLEHKALLLYQQLVAFHLNDAKPDALIDVDVARLKYVRSKSVHPDKEQLYFTSINHLAHQYAETPAATIAWYETALFFKQKGDTYRPRQDSTHRLDIVKAKTILDKLAARKDSTEGKINALNLLNEINRKELRFEVEQVNLPEKPFRSLVTYRNTKELSFRIVALTDAIKKILADQQQSQEDKWAKITAAPIVRAWKQSLPGTEDLQEHQAEVKIDGLPIGAYLLFGFAGEKLADKTMPATMATVHVSNIAFVNRDRHYFVVNRESGQPLEGAAVQGWEQRYDYDKSAVVNTRTDAYRTDAKGYFLQKARVPKNTNRSYVMGESLEISHQKDYLFIENAERYYYRNPSSTPKKTEKSVFFFTDRSIYRPGQLLHFKAIAVSKAPGERSAIVSGAKVTVILRDGNRQKIDSLVLTTNEYGSVSGKFNLPVSGITGQFTIEAVTYNGNAYFRVEEYKRPKFEVAFEPLTNTYRLNDKVLITGTAKAYAGNNIDGAIVKYRVKRQARYPVWTRGKSWMPPSSEQEIAHGEIKTDKDGKFRIEFTAIPDAEISKELDPVFNYSIEADVTDINGETRSGTETVQVGYKALRIVNMIPGTLHIDSISKLGIRTENMNGDFQQSPVTVTFTKLKSEQRLIRARYWERPDQFTMAKDEYVKLFPQDEYDNETDKQSWPDENRAWSGTDTTRPDYQWMVEKKKWTPGYYRIDMETKDRFGETVRNAAFVELYDVNSKTLTNPQYVWYDFAVPVEPGEKAVAQIGSSAENVHLVQFTERRTLNDSAVVSFASDKISNEIKKTGIPITENDRGGFGFGWVFVKHNRFYDASGTITVPWTNKQVAIEYATFRDKTLPGSEEKWSVKITGNKKEKVAAELLASMYDASLDQFNPHSWQQPGIWPAFYSSSRWESTTNMKRIQSETRYIETENRYYELNKQYDRLILQAGGYFADDLNGSYRFQTAKRAPAMAAQAARNVEMAAPVSEEIAAGGMDRKEYKIARELTDSTAAAPREENTPTGETSVVPRKNFNETAFFIPDLKTDADGNISFSFTMPEALTRWKFQALAHTKDLAFGYSSKEIITQKELMVQPNAPRFLREGDKMEFSAKIVNLSDKEMTGQAAISIFDASTNEPVDARFRIIEPTQYFTVAAGQSEPVKFAIEIPHQFSKSITWRVIAKAGTLSDGEEAALPVLTNRTLVTETRPLNVKGTGTKEFTFDNLVHAGESESLQTHKLTLEYTSNPAWYAVQALPYLMEYPYECAEQTWNRYYANALASLIANSNPKIKAIFEKWKNIDTSALLSNLEKNPELKSLLLEETPWVLQAKSESEQKKNIALLFDMVKMTAALNSSYEKLKQMQSPNGGFVWFTGGPDDRYITQYIVTGIGHLQKLKAIPASQETKIKAILDKAIPYLDRKIKEDYDQLVKNKTNLGKYTPGYSEIQYLYMRSFFPQYKIATASQKAVTYYKTRLPVSWTSRNKYMQGMSAITLFRNGDSKTAKAILASLKETSIVNEELGRYWKDARRSWWWYEAPLERQALVIEAFEEIANDTKTADELRTWLLKNKQTNRWETTKSTSEACYALLLKGTQWLSSEPVITIKAGSSTFRSTDLTQEAGTGYFKTSIEGEKVKPDMGRISVTVDQPADKNVAISPGATTWGAAYWQYFEDLDKIKTAATPLSLVKKLFVETNSDRGPVLTPVQGNAMLKVGDKIKVRIELRVDRDMEYVHMKDMRASALEPVNVLSGYRWQGGLGYYESTRDAATNFFFSYLPKGTYVFEYALFVTHSGDFSNGITTIQSMYAPEFTSHSEGVRILVD